MKEKTVFILGAGFSIEAGAPSQSELVKKIFDTAKKPDVFKEDYFEKFKTFLNDTLCIPKEKYEDVPLEDIFTPLDRCIADNISFRDLDVQQAVEMRSLIYYLISQTMDSLLKNASVKKVYINKFAKYIIDQVKIRNDYNYHHYDPISIISTNWDILLDNSLQSMIDPPPIDGSCNNKAVIDYNCHISSFKEDDNTIKPALEIMGRGGFCVKLIKLHGSLNWLQCPKCQRVYAAFKEKIAILPYKDDYYCRHCEANYGNNDKSNRLTSNMVMPTFLKDFTNPQYKMIWRGAGIELSEASKLVFIGYSLPQADFELRQLLSRMVRKEAEIEVVSKGKNNDMEKRYEIFFGSRKIKFYRKGAKHFIINLKA